MTVRLSGFALVAGVAAVAAMAGCSSDTIGSNMHPVQLSIVTHATGSNVLGSGQAVDPAGNLILQNVEVVLGKLELDQTGTTDCIAEDGDGSGDNSQVLSNDQGSDGGDMGEGCEDVSHDPLLIDVPIDATLHPLMNIPLAAGTFAKLEAKIEPAGDQFTAFNALNPDLVGNSIRVQGMFKGVSFTFTTPLRAKVEMEFDPPLVINDATKNATVSLDVAHWFLDASGNAIDPSTATPGSANLSLIEDNIRRSFHAFEDDHERGEDDHEGNSGNGDGSSHS